MPSMPELVAPAPLLAAALLALNDHWLKARWPGPITGKLSDLAGAFVLPLFASAALALLTRWPLRRRLAVGVAITLGLLLAVKLSPSAAAWTVRALDWAWAPLSGTRGRLVADATDLVALPFALLAWAYGVRVERPRREAPCT